MNKYQKNGLSLVAIVFSLSITTVVLANGFRAPAASATMPYFDGPYIGIGIGVVSTHADVKSESSHEFPDENQSPHFYISRNLDLGGRDVDANVFVGYGETLNSSYYLGGELFGHYINPIHESFNIDDLVYVLTNRHFPLNLGVKMKNRYSFGGDIRAGYLVLPRTMLYVLFGLDYSKFKIENESSFLPDIGLHHETISDSFTEWEMGYLPGVGIETGLTDHVSLRVQYTHTFYSSFSHTATRSDIYGKDQHYHGSLKTKVKPSRGLFTVKLSYLFN